MTTSTKFSDADLARFEACILSGELDSELDFIDYLVSKRRDFLNPHPVSRRNHRNADGQFSKGQRVRIKNNPNIRPTYLSGTLGTLGVKKGTKWVFMPDPGTPAHIRNDTWRIPPDCLEACQ